MAKWLFRYFLVNDGQYSTLPSITFTPTGNATVRAVYEEEAPPPEDTLEATLRGVKIYKSAMYGDYYVVGTDFPEPPRFPTLDEAIEWVIATIRENLAPIAVGLVAGAVFLYWLFTRKG